MPDWKKEIQKPLADVKLAPTREAKIIEELSQHLEDRYKELLRGGATAEEAYRMAITELNDQEVLACHCF